MHFPLAATSWKERVHLADPLGHPDLARLGRAMRDRLDETLEAEQHAARAAALRRRTLRDLVLEAEDRGAAAVLSGTDGQVYRGVVTAVGADHVVLASSDGTERFVSLAQVVSLEVR